MIIFDAPADTFNYMILGFGVILGCIVLYIVNLALRFQRISREIDVYQTVEVGEEE